MLRYGIVFAAASLLVQAKAEASFCANPSADGTCTPNNSSDVFLVDYPNFGFVWPPRLENGALWIAFVLVAYFYGFISSRFILSENEKFHKKRKLEMENSKLAQTVVEVKRTAYKIQEYRKKCEEAEVLARKLLAEGEESQYSDAIMVARFETTMTVEGELGEEELPMIEVQEPAATDPLRIYRVLFDNINEKGLRQVSDRAINIKKYIGSPESVQKYQESFNKVRIRCIGPCLSACCLFMYVMHACLYMYTYMYVPNQIHVRLPTAHPLMTILAITILKFLFRATIVCTQRCSPALYLRWKMSLRSPSRRRTTGASLTSPLVTSSKRCLRAPKI